MARRLPLLALSAGVGLAAAAAQASSSGLPGVLVSYSFEEEGLETGPDTFAVYENSRGRVELSQEISLSGWSSIRIEDAAGDGDFPELQGYFPERSKGRLYAHFALLFAEPDEEANVALAGPAGFALAPGGIAFWLRLVDGELWHVSDSIPRRLVAVRSFVWYGVDAAFDLGAGTYDLTIREEGLDEPVARVVGAPNATAAPGSAVDKFSFIGDLPDRDRSRTVYFVDDVLLGTDARVLEVPFVAPGRRRLFFDRCRAPARGDLGGGPCPAPAPASEDPNAGPGFDELFNARRYDEAAALALERVDTAADPASRASWRERAAAAEYFLGMRPEAETELRAALGEAPGRPSILVALSDLAWLRGDLDAERTYRESVYGSLSPDR